MSSKYLPKLSSIVFAISLCLSAGTSLAEENTAPGYPERENIKNLELKFKTPPAGYGEVPFYWWMGNTLTREHLLWELDKLADSHISSLQVNYCHQDHGGIIYGLTYPSQPALFSEEWWDLFAWFMDEAGKRGMTVSLSDYTLGPGQGSYVDRMLQEKPYLNGFELHCDTISLRNGETFSRQYLQQPLSVTAFAIDNGVIDNNRTIDVNNSFYNDTLSWTAPENALLSVVYASRKIPSINPMHPESGESYVKHFFGMFEDRFPGKAQKGLNFFFSDELNLALGGNIWSDNFRQEFKKRKGYDILPYIHHLFMEIGDITPKIRLDYNDVRVSLSEEYFFKPLYDWHDERGLLFGCDHGGRGKDVSEFGDYFRTQRWNQAPGCDQPNLEKDIVKNKVASSISHLYNRQRVWLEGFHSSGWGTNSAQLTDAIFANFAMGHNLLSLHGLYYTTKGGRWEWAPPCNHFHEPYWTDMKPLLECTERLSYILSQGYHVADVAVIYPVEPVIAGYGDKAVNTAFSAGEHIYRDGIDFDFIDYESIGRSKIKNKSISVAGENYKVIVIPSMKAMRHTSLQKIRDFARKGGIVISIGDRPVATDLEGAHSKRTAAVLKDIFESNRPNVIEITDTSDLSGIIARNITRDFDIISKHDSNDIPYIMHRRIDNRHLYAVYNVDKGTVCRFRATGGAELWNPYTGEKTPLEIVNTGKDYTDISIPMHKSDMNLIVFDSSTHPIYVRNNNEQQSSRTISLDGEWTFTVEPVLDNAYGDFHWPPTNEKLGVFIYGAPYEQLDSVGNIISHSGYKTFAYGEKFRLLKSAGTIDSIYAKSLNADSVAHWEPYDFSWRWGVENDYGRQGWHGLKGEMDQNFIRLGEMYNEFNGTFRRQENGVGHYYLYTEILAPRQGIMDSEWGDITPAEMYVNGVLTPVSNSISLSEGRNRILLHYDRCGTTRFVVRDSLIADNASELLAELPLAMKYRGDLSIMPFDARSSFNTYSRFSLLTAPGTEALEVMAFQKPQAIVDSITCDVTEIYSRSDGAALYRIVIPEAAPEGAYVTLTFPEQYGYAGAAIIDAPIKLICGKGTLAPGNWEHNDALRTYSGAARYSRTVDIDDIPLSAVLNLGDLVASATVFVNGTEIGTRLAAPWEFEIAPFLKKGSNIIEVRVCNTAANIFLSSPTRYRGNIKAGLIGPVSLTLSKAI